MDEDPFPVRLWEDWRKGFVPFAELSEPVVLADDQLDTAEWSHEQLVTLWNRISDVVEQWKAQSAPGEASIRVDEACEVSKAILAGDLRDDASYRALEDEYGDTILLATVCLKNAAQAAYVAHTDPEVGIYNPHLIATLQASVSIAVLNDINLREKLGKHREQLDANRSKGPETLKRDAEKRKMDLRNFIVDWCNHAELSLLENDWDALREAYRSAKDSRNPAISAAANSYKGAEQVNRALRGVRSEIRRIRKRRLQCTGQSG